MSEFDRDNVNLQSLNSSPRSARMLSKPLLAFYGVVAVPTLVAGVYLYGVATPQYVSEARFVVRQPNQNPTGVLAGTLSGIGIGGGNSDTFVVHEYLRSHEAVEALAKEVDLPQIIGAKSALDVFSRYPRPWETKNTETLNKAYRRHVVVGYDSTTSVTTLRVAAFNRNAAHLVAEKLLELAEEKVNALNERSAANALKDAEQMLESAEQSLTGAQNELSKFRNNQNLVDPRVTLEEASRLISTLEQQVSLLKAERRQLASGAPDSPLLSQLDVKIRAFEQQIAQERRELSGSTSSLAAKVGEYQSLILKQELADRFLSQAKAAQISAIQEQRRQNLYVERVVDPSKPDVATEPRRLKRLLTVLLSALMIYGLGWLVWAGVREHHQA
ncbi:MULTISPECIES: chain-length determining protein [unclassified Brevundimonas]|uniref:chain-length determining protein n=1 Tax=unclassified Brevundimonas TaxID=2622653 RepID=UPI0025C3C716|nr:MULTISPECIES: chain-length determining protein [unclassified Brevundimonas]